MWTQAALPKTSRDLDAHVARVAPSPALLPRDRMTSPTPPAARTSNSAVPAVLLLALALAVAAGLLVLRLHFQPPTVPVYALVPEPGEREVRVTHGGEFTAVAQPERTVVGAVAARGFLVRGTEVRPWDPPFEVTRDGSIRISGKVDVLFAGVPEGAWEVALAVGRPENLPTAPSDVLRGSADAGVAAWRLLRERIRLGG
jgi:hypothetical protein